MKVGRIAAVAIAASAAATLLSSSPASAESMTTLNTQCQAKGSTYSDGMAIPTTTVKLGSNGVCVKLAQFMASTEFAGTAQCGNIAVDGVFGSGTQACIKYVQKQYALGQDGIVGRGTWTALFQYYPWD